MRWRGTLAISVGVLCTKKGVVSWKKKCSAAMFLKLFKTV